VRRPLGPPAVLLTLLLALAGCGSGGDGGGETEATAVPGEQALDQVTVSGGEGEQPTVDLEGEVRAADTAREVLREGDGEVVEAGQRVTVEYVGVNGRDGEVFDTSYGGQPATFTLDEGVIAGFAEGLTGVPVGSRVVVAVAPSDGYGPQGGVPDAGIEADDTLVFVIDVTSAAAVAAVLDRAEGEPVTPPAGLPTVTLAEDGAPTVTLPEGEPPAELVVQPLITGTGPVVESGQVVTVHYTGLTWPGGEVFDSSWERGQPAEFPIGVGRVIDGWDSGIVGQPVGSQLLLVIPPALGYGEDGNPEAGIEGTDTLVFVVDVLAAQDAPAGS
jgi:peptidylprolyl isomerase